MDPGLLKLYNQELAHLREMGAEFGREFPKIAARLTMDGLEVADPYVERLLEGFAFMAARTQLKLDAEYPRFIQHLLETVYPNFLSPVPSMLVARLQPNQSGGKFACGRERHGRSCQPRPTPLVHVHPGNVPVFKSRFHRFGVAQAFQSGQALSRTSSFVPDRT